MLGVPVICYLPEVAALAGGLFVGLVVGTALGAGLATSRPALKLTLTAIGAAAGGASAIVPSDSPARWMYPIGLLLGIMWLRVPDARRILAAYHSRPAKGRAIDAAFASLDLFVIALATIVAVLYATFVKGS